jgi:soluble lytic murein transglycosylase
VRARASTLRATPPEPGQYDVDPALAALPGLRAAVALLRSGIPEEAAAELEVALGPKPWERWDGESLVFASHLYELAGDPARSHHLLRRAFAARMEEAPASAPALFHAYPLAYWDAVRGATDSFGWDPLAFQALVREESGFSPAIVSWAGAIGLSQLMWPTAKDTAKRMGLRIDRASLNDPATNARIGATYLNGLLTRYRGHLPLAIAAYNAGPGAVSKWVGERPGDPLDLWVESIPYDQTRDYVKRVVGSFHTYRFLRGDSVPVAPLRVGPVQAAIDAADPTWPG